MFEQSNFAGKSILVIEEDFFEELNIALEAYGQRSCEAGDVRAQTVALLKGAGITAAILDGHLDSEKSAPVAAALTELGIPFVISEGNAWISDIAGIEERTAELTLLAHGLFGAPTFH